MIKLAARLRVEGNSWKQIAPRIGRSSDLSARSITQEHKELWRSEYEQARALYLDEVEGEAILTQRSLLRSTDERVRQMAAHSLLNHCRQLRPTKLEHHIPQKLTAEFASDNTEGGDDD